MGLQDFSASVALSFLPEFRQIVKTGFKRRRKEPRDIEKDLITELPKLDPELRPIHESTP